MHKQTLVYFTGSLHTVKASGLLSEMKFSLTVSQRGWVLILKNLCQSQ